MKLSFRNIASFLLLAFGQKVLAQQDPLYNQYLLNQSMLNPAYVGIHDMGNITAITRGQWVGIEGAPYTYSFIGTSTISDHSGLGIQIVNDSYGINSNMDLGMAYAYRMELTSKAVLSFGLQTNYTMYTQDFSKIDFEDVNDPAIGTGRNTFSQQNFGAGMMLKNEFFYLGIATPRMMEGNINQGDVVVSAYKRSYNLTAGLLIAPTDVIQIKPSTLVRYQDGKLAVDLNGQLLINKKVWLGVTSRNFSSGGVNFIYQHRYVYNFGYSFEFPFGAIGKANYGIHELMFSADIKFRKGQKMPDRFF